MVCRVGTPGASTPVLDDVASPGANEGHERRLVYRHDAGRVARRAGPHYALAGQFTAVDASPSPWELSPGSKTLYSTLPPPTVPSYAATANFTTVADAKAAENGLAEDYYPFLTTGGSGLSSGGVDARIASYGSLLPGPFQLTGATLTDDDYAGSPVHRFYQMWQQLDCNAAYATAENPSGCLSDLWP
jgi:phospholipase C